MNITTEKEYEETVNEVNKLNMIKENDNKEQIADSNDYNKENEYEYN